MGFEGGHAKNMASEGGGGGAGKKKLGVTEGSPKKLFLVLQ